VLARAWQMLLKGIEEVQTAPSAKQAAEMLLVRLAYVADLPAPAELVKSIATGEPLASRPAANPPAPARPAAVAPPPAADGDTGMVGFEPAAPSSRPLAVPVTLAPRADSGNAAPVMVVPEPAEIEPAEPQPFAAALPAPPTGPAFDPMPQDFAELLALFETHGEVITRAQLRSQLHLVAFEPGRIEFRPAENAPRDLSNRLMQRLREWTGVQWAVAISQAEGAPTLEQQEQSRDSEMKSQVAAHPLVRAVLDAFPGATIAAVRERFVAAGPSADETLGEETLAADDEAAASEEDEP
jgi:DNA polymerase III subunit gamma/tau